MGEEAARGVEGCIDAVLHTSVATLYNNLVTRPTGRAVRIAIEEQIEEASGTCLSILDFSRVGVVDFSCADEVIAKLLSKYRDRNRPSNAYFVLHGVREHHREPIETVLWRHNLLVVAVEGERPALWGPAPPRLRLAWNWLGQLGRALAGEFASAQGLDSSTANSWLKRLANSRVAIPEGGDCFASLSSVVGRSTDSRTVQLPI